MLIMDLYMVEYKMLPSLGKLFLYHFFKILMMGIIYRFIM